nr:CinA family protein [Marinitoga sp. 1154]
MIFKDNKEKLKSIIDFINNQLIEYVVPYNPLKYIINNLSNNNKTISTAESCTGGLVGNFITNIPGSSRVYKGSIVAYNNFIKNKLLYVDNEVLKNYGAVSEETVKLMAINTAKIFNSDYSISISGIAGPKGGTKHLPVGTIFFGFYCNLCGKIIIEKKIFSGNRILIKRKAAFYSLIRFLKLFL